MRSLAREGAVHLNRVIAAESTAQLLFASARVMVSRASGYFIALLYKRFQYNLWVPIAFHFVLNGLGLFAASDNPTGILINLAGIIGSYCWIHSATKDIADFVV